MEKDKKRLENLIKEYKNLIEVEQEHRKENGELRERVKELEEEIERQKDINTIINKNNLDDKYEEVLEKVMTKFLNNNIENDYIPKSKVKEKIEELETKCNEEYNTIKAKAYNVRIEDNYAIELRDEFNKNAGKYEIIVQIKRKILDLLEKGAKE